MHGYIPEDHWDVEKGMWVLDKPFKYTSKRFNRTITVPAGAESDGATGALDIDSAGWWVHDWLCDQHGFDDGYQPTRWEASLVLSDILASEGRLYRAWYWKWSTYLFGSKKLKF